MKHHLGKRFGRTEDLVLETERKPVDSEEKRSIIIFAESVELHGLYLQRDED